MKSLIFAATIVALVSFSGCSSIRNCGLWGNTDSSYCQECNEYSGDGVQYEGQYFPAEERLSPSTLPSPEVIGRPPAV